MSLAIQFNNQSHKRSGMMSTVEERLSTLEAEIQAVKRQLSVETSPRAWLERVAGSMDSWPEFSKVTELGRQFRQSVADGSAVELGD